MTHFRDVDPKTFHKVDRSRTRTSVPPPAVQSSLTEFPGLTTLTGKISTKKIGSRLETFTELLNPGSSTNVIRHPTLSCSYTVLEGSGFLSYKYSIQELSTGSVVVIDPKNDFRFYTEGSHVLLAVTQEKYYDLEVELVEEVGGSSAVVEVSPKARPVSKLAEQQVAAREGRPQHEAVSPANEDAVYDAFTGTWVK